MQQIEKFSVAAEYKMTGRRLQLTPYGVHLGNTALSSVKPVHLDLVDPQIRHH